MSSKPNPNDIKRNDKVAYTDKDGNRQEGHVFQTMRGNGPQGWATVVSNGQFHSTRLENLEKLDASQTEQA